ncbi:Crp/Fnr family transcriptional regulator [Candidatus Korobacter versatilis]|nr:cyclic nucleotide-binding domain-containing protein [Candidatus Koribacter versatilis]
MKLFRSIDAGACQSLLSICEIQERLAGDVLYREGEASRGLYMVLRGGVKLTQRKSQNEFLLGCPSEIIGMPAVLHGPCHRHTATVMVRSLFAYINRADCLNFLRDHPKAAEAIAASSDLQLHAQESAA